MNKGLFWRGLLAGSVILLAFYFLLPVVFPQLKDAPKDSFLAKIIPDTGINLGLDLRGGIQLTLGVEVDKALQNNLTQTGQSLMSSANDQGILMTTPKLLGEDRLEFILTTPAKKNDLTELLRDKFSQMVVAEPKELSNGRLLYNIGMSDSARAELEDQVIDQALVVIRSRIDKFGVAEPDIRKQQGGRISVQLPGIDNTQRAIAIIGQTAQLEFRLARLNVMLGTFAPAGVEFLPMKASSPDAPVRKIAVEKQPILTGKHVTSAWVDFDKGMPFVSLTLDQIGGQIFEKVTGENVDGHLAIVLDNIVHSAPQIKTRIDGGRVQITGSFSVEEAMDLALVLRAGALPAPVLVLEERTVGPSLGQESIDMGVKAALVGCGAIMIFMFVYYGISGLIADLMVLLDVVLILAGMAVFGATLTLPGIAGIVLTLGMAVDANVLIFERIREELANGTGTLMEAVEAGFSRASLAIVDSNLTTVIAGVLLYQFGTGPVRGFAVTLTLGILVSMFTAVFVSRIIFNIWLGKPGRKISI